MSKEKKDKLKLFLITLTIILFYATTCLILITFIYHYVYQDKVYPGVYVQNQHLGNWRKDQVASYFNKKNSAFKKAAITFTWKEKKWTLKASEIKWGYNENQIAKTAFQFGRSNNFIDNTKNKITTFFSKTHLPAKYKYDQVKLYSFLQNINTQVHIAPVDALFEFQGGKVTTFRPSKPGRGLNFNKVLVLLKNQLADNPPHQINIDLPVEEIPAAISEANDLGIRELVGTGTSNFTGSPFARIYNIDLASLKLHGQLIAPGEVFSFNERIGTISAKTGYKQAYIIKRGKTVLDDGGGVCQVSTTLYRAALYSGLPTIERRTHAYRVGYYEPPIGMDATVYQPSPDLKFKNDTPSHILIQRYFDPSTSTLSFLFYGTNDGRLTTIKGPFIISQTPIPEPTYQDDPNLPKGQTKQIDQAHPGAKAYFERTVIKDNKTIIQETIHSNYVPWPAVILRGTKE